MPRAKAVTVRLSDEQLTALDDFADDEFGGNRSRAVQALVDLIEEVNASTSGPELDADDLRVLLESRARAGSVTAIKELQRRHDLDAGQAEVDRLNAMT